MKVVMEGEPKLLGLLIHQHIKGKRRTSADPLHCVKMFTPSSCESHPMSFTCNMPGIAYE